LSSASAYRGRIRGTFLWPMTKEIETLITEIAKPVERIQKDVVLSTISTFDASDPEVAPMIFFLLKTLFQFALSQSHQFISSTSLRKYFQTRP
jgi:hypothetical protein